jgi:hypothetical protein
MQVHYCQQCGEDMGNEWLLGPVCGACCRLNHRTVTGADRAAEAKRKARNARARANRQARESAYRDCGMVAGRDSAGRRIWE